MVESKLGKLECEGLTGYTMQNFRFSGREIETQHTFHIRLHKKAPFGVVSARVNRETTRDGQPFTTATRTYTLTEFGEGAQSELPDHN